MAVPDDSFCSIVGRPKRLPARAAGTEHVEKSKFLKIKEAHRRDTLDRIKLRRDQRCRPAALTITNEGVAQRPPADISDRHTGKPSGLGERVDSDRQELLTSNPPRLRLDPRDPCGSHHGAAMM